MYGRGSPTNVVAPGLLAFARVEDSGTFPGRSAMREVEGHHQRADHTRGTGCKGAERNRLTCEILGWLTWWASSLLLG